MKYLLTGEETERLKFRLVAQADYNDWLPFFRRDGVAEFVGLGHLDTPEAKCDAWFERCLKRYENGLGGLNVLIDKQTNRIVGKCGLLIQEINGVDRMEVGYSLLPKHWGKGYALEAARKCRDYAFENNFWGELISTIHIDNHPSKQVAINNGMKLSEATEFRGMPVHIFRITREEWMALEK